jgi:RHS repeat-associated protein
VIQTNQYLEVLECYANVSLRPYFTDSIFMIKSLKQSGLDLINKSLQENTGENIYICTLTSTIAYFPFGETRASTGTLPTERLFTGQRLDDNTGLYYYNARYYDPEIGRFISPDTIVPDPADPQSLNRYSYCRNNPLRYIDPSGHGDYDFDEYSIPDDYYEYLENYKSGKTDGGYSDWKEQQNEVIDIVVDAYDFYVNGINSSVENLSGKYEITARYTKDKFHDIDVWMAHDTGTHYVTNHDLVVACDALAVGGDLVSFFGGAAAPIGYTVSAISSTISYKITVDEYRKGNVSENDMLAAHLNWTLGFIPYVGALPAGFQYKLDVFGR